MVQHRNKYGVRSAQIPSPITGIVMMHRMNQLHLFNGMVNAMDIIEHSKSLKYAVVERKGKVYAMERGSIMNSDKIHVWTDTLLNARSWRGAIISDKETGYSRQWSPFPGNAPK